MTVSAEHITQVSIWREKARAGLLTQTEMREAIIFLRGERVGATPTARKPAAVIINATDLLSELDNL